MEFIKKEKPGDKHRKTKSFRIASQNQLENIAEITVTLIKILTSRNFKIWRKVKFFTIQKTVIFSVFFQRFKKHETEKLRDK